MRRAGGPLGRLLDRAGRKNRLEQRARALLPADLAEHCLGIEQEGDRLCLVMSSPAWAARARYGLAAHEAELKALLSPPARRLETRAARRGGTDTPSPGRETPANASRQGLSENTRRHLREVARHIRDPRLREALERLGRK